MGDRDLFWLAGLLEGEGWFGTTHGKYPAIQVSMTDLDVVERAARLLETKVSVQPTRPNTKQAWTARIYGHRAAEWMRRLLPHMGERRGVRIRELLTQWDSWEHKMPKGSGLRSPAKCHPDRPAEGGGLCGTCYMRKYRTGWRVREVAVA
jgi:hypothetical protein